MAGTFTHFMVCKKAAQSPALADLNNSVPLLNSHRNALFFGAVGPDLPYLSVTEEIGLKHSWADYMHYIETNGIVIRGVRSIYEKWGSREDTITSQLVWLFGYASHLIADATIHPIVESIVGPYERNKTEHRICEQAQDTLIFKEMEVSEIVGSNFVSTNLRPVPEEIFGFWKLVVLMTYFPGIGDLSRLRGKSSSQRPRKTVRDIVKRRIRIDSLENSLNPIRWSNRYNFLLSQAAGGLFYNLARNVNVGEDLLYKKSGEIPAGQRQKYYLSVKMPGGRPEAPFKYGFDCAVANVVSGWKVLYDGVINGKNVSEFYKNWNLDTGIDQETGEMTFWP